MELVGWLEEWAKEIALDGTPSQIGPYPSELTEAAACIREMVEWRPIETAPRDGRYILAVMTGADGRWEHLNGRAFVIRNRSLSADDYDLGWDVYPGFGGVSDRWFSGWLPLPPAPGAEDE